MVTQADILEIIASGENSKVEFKRDIVKNEDVARELVALSNMQGGVVLLGVANDHTVVGLTRDNIEEWVMTLCRDKIRPAIIPTFSVFKDVEPGKDVAVIEVERSIYVHSLYHGNKNTYYIRVGSQNREPTSEELARLFQQRGMFRVDIQPIPGAKVQDLDQRRLKDYFCRIRQQEIPDDGDDAGWRTLLFNTELIVEDGVTLSAILLFGKNPNRFLPQAGIDAAIFPGIEKDYAMVERATIRGPMTPLMNQDGKILETGLVEQAIDFVKRNTPVTATLESGRRIEKRAYPDEPIREAIVNALIHRDYLLAGTDIELAVYQDRLEIISPGKLRNGITPDRMRAGTRSTRNEVLKDVMRDYKYMEHMGMGVPRKIVRGMKEHNGTDPDLIEEGERFVVRLFAKKQPT
ncbi:MAG: putative DNA binding domain-containing protein [Gammaproteobacteria bacterium]|nr:putative DNA binding domain-containing protein [Gammaproteobacteria bacterium]